MNPLGKIAGSPLRLLLYIEWVVLVSCASLAIIEALEKQYLPIQHILILVLLGFIGFVKPGSKTLTKMLYTLIQVSLIFYGTTLGYLHLLPMLYLIVVIRSCFIFELFERTCIAGLSFILFFVHQVQYLISITPQIQPQAHYHFWMQQLSELLMFALALLFLLQLVNTLLAAQKTRQQLDLANEQLRQYAKYIEDLAAVQERNRTTREIHDSLGHLLTALNIQLQTAGKLWQCDSKLAQSFLVQAQSLGTTAMKEVRQSVRILSTDAGVESLETAIASLVKEHCQATGLLISTYIQLFNPILPSPVVKILYQIVQQTLTNCKHSQATEVKIQLNTNSNRVYLSVEDNGKGFNCKSESAGFGLQSMQEWVAEIKGNFHLETKSDSGCKFSVELPLSEPLK